MLKRLVVDVNFIVFSLSKLSGVELVGNSSTDTSESTIFTGIGFSVWFICINFGLPLPVCRGTEGGVVVGFSGAEMKEIGT